MYVQSWLIDDSALSLVANNRANTIPTPSLV